MKTVLTIIITAIVTVIITILVVHAVSSEGDCVFNWGDDDHDKECTEEVKKGCCDKKEHSGEEAHEMMMEKLEPIRAEFDAQLSDEEKATIAAIREKFGEKDHTELCAEGKAKFMEEHKGDIDALVAIADNHKEYFDGLFAKVHDEKDCKHAEEGEVVKTSGCPEAAACKEATEKCKGEQKTPEAEAKCKDAEAACKKSEAECKEACASTFKVHFLLMEDD